MPSEIKKALAQVRACIDVIVEKPREDTFIKTSADCVDALFAIANALECLARAVPERNESYEREER